MRNGTLQGALPHRRCAGRWDWTAAPMSGFDNVGVDKAFFLWYANPIELHLQHRLRRSSVRVFPRNPRLSFEGGRSLGLIFAACAGRAEIVGVG